MGRSEGGRSDDEMEVAGDKGEGWWWHAIGTKKEREGRGMEEDDRHEMTRSDRRGNSPARGSTVEVAVGFGEDKGGGGSVTLGQRGWKHDVERGHAKPTMADARLERL